MNKETKILMWCKIINKHQEPMTLSLYIPILNFEEYINETIKKYNLIKFETNTLLLSNLRESYIIK
jgi:hypothetical protein